MFNNNTELELQNKLMILMLLNDIGLPLSNEKITDLVIKSNLIDYISLQHYITELNELYMLDKISKENTIQYVLTENGRVSLDFFKARIPPYFQDKINSIVLEYKKKLPIKTDISAIYEQIDETNFLVSLNIFENNKKIMNININTISNKHAKLICNKWNKKASYLYGDIINLLTSHN